ncbi:MAG: hypothetical protein LBC04_01290 [Holosporaceae bacterium]|nr:hypothetical protein [Holosporaceae bacterium]
MKSLKYVCFASGMCLSVHCMPGPVMSVSDLNRSEKYNVEEFRSLLDEAAIRDYGAHIKKMYLNESNALVLLDRDPTIFSALENIVIKDLEIYSRNVELFKRLAALKEVEFDGCRPHGSEVLRLLEEHFQLDGGEKGDLNGKWRAKK